jgi:hypothetical protein
MYFGHILRLNERTYASPLMFYLFYIPVRAKHFLKGANHVEGRTSMAYVMAESRNYDHLH